MAVSMLASSVLAAPAAASARRVERRCAASAARSAAKPASFEGFRASPAQKFAGCTRFASVAASRATRPAAARAQVVTQAGYKVAILGAAGGIGQPLSLLMKMNPLVSKLAIYDIANTPGVGADLSHINTPAQIEAFAGADQLATCLKGADLVVIPAGVPRKPGMTRDDLFNINAGIVKSLCEAISVNCPKAVVAIISNPVNSTVPIAAEVFKKAGTFDPAKLFGVTTLDIVRANTFVSAAKGVELPSVSVPVVGGHAGITILPLLSQAEPKGLTFSNDELDKLTKRIQDAGTEVVEAKAGAGSATLSMAYAAARFSESVLRGLAGEQDVVECAFVASNVEPSLPFFSSKVRLGKNGAAEVYPVGPMTEYEKGWYAKMLPELKSSIQKGIEFANK